MKQIMKRMLAMGLAVVTMSGCFQGVALNSYAQKEAALMEPVVLTKEFKPEQENNSDSEELFAGYVENLFYENLGGASAAAELAGMILNDKEKQFFDNLKGYISEIAEGKRASTDIVLDVEFTWTAKELGVNKITYNNYAELVSQKYNEELNYNNIWDCLLHDCPYEMYWYDKTVSADGLYYISLAADGSFVTVFDIHVGLPVVEEYQNPKAEEANRLKSFNTELVKGVSKAKENAQSIVEANKNLSDYRKMLAYGEEICKLASYNHEAADNEDTPYGNPWQLIWVFDGDENTKVVCEGYSKAFQYLCDLSGLTCYSVCGVLSWGIGAGPHMWNIVTLDGSNYLVDLTNCDDDTAGYMDELFLAGTAGNVEEGYTFSLGYDLGYYYWEDQIALFGEKILTISPENYTVKEEPTSKPVTEVFVDVSENDWFVDAVQFVYDKGIIVGDGNVFAPYGNTTRAMVAVILWRMEGSPKVLDYGKYNEFTDLPKEHSWYSDAVAWALNEGVATGDDYHKLYNPDTPVTREQLALFLWRYMEYKNVDVTVDRPVAEILGGTYVNDWAKDGFAWAVDKGIIKGSEYTGANGQIIYDLMPQNGATRAQFATVLQRIYKDFALTSANQ